MKVNYILNDYVFVDVKKITTKSRSCNAQPRLFRRNPYSDRKAMLANRCDDLAGENPLAC